MIGINGNNGAEDNQQRNSYQQEEKQSICSPVRELYPVRAPVNQHIQEDADWIANLPEDPEPVRSIWTSIEQASIRKDSGKCQQVGHIDQTNIQVDTTQYSQRWKMRATELSKEQIGSHQCCKDRENGKGHSKGWFNETSHGGVWIRHNTHEDQYSAYGECDTVMELRRLCAGKALYFMRGLLGVLAYVLMISI